MKICIYGTLTCLVCTRKQLDLIDIRTHQGDKPFHDYKTNMPYIVVIAHCPGCDHVQESPCALLPDMLPDEIHVLSDRSYWRQAGDRRSYRRAHPGIGFRALQD